MRDQLRKQVQRLRELRVKKVEEPGEPLDNTYNPLVLNW